MSRVRLPTVSLEFLLTQISSAQYDSAVDLGSNRNEYQEYFLGGKCGPWIMLKTLTFSPADSPEIWEPQPPQNLLSCPDLYRDCFTCNLCSLLFNFFHLQLGTFTFLSV